MDILDNSLVWMPENEILKQKGFVQMMHNKWFIVHPDTGDLLFYQSIKRRQGQLRGASPQCNGDETIARSIKEKMYPWANIKYFEVVACPIRIEDYA